MRHQKNIPIMQMEKITIRLKEFLLWIYIAVVAAGIICAVTMGCETQSPGEIIYEKSHYSR